MRACRNPPSVAKPCAGASRISAAGHTTRSRASAGTSAAWRSRSLSAVISTARFAISRIPQRRSRSQGEWDLHLMCVAATKDLLDVGRNLVIVALVGAHLHIRIFDASGKKVVDKAESELISGEILTALKKRLNPFPDEFSLSKEDKQEIIRNATSIAGHTHQDRVKIKLKLLDAEDRRGYFGA